LPLRVGQLEGLRVSKLAVTLEQGFEELHVDIADLRFLQRVENAMGEELRFHGVLRLVTIDIFENSLL
jgi:hypothetical protein